MNQALFQYALRLGDTDLILSQRLAECCGHGPALEEDLALTNVALDLLGQARLWLTLAGEIEGGGRDEDTLAYLRDAHDYRNCLLVERPNGHYGDIVARQFLFDVWHYFLLRELCGSSEPRVAEVAGKAVKEVAYHVRRSTDLLVRLGDGTEFSHGRMQASLEAAWPYVGELFHDDGITRELAAQGIAPLHASLWEPWWGHVEGALDDATLAAPPAADASHPAHRGGIEGRHTEALGYILADMQFLQRAYPGAKW